MMSVYATARRPPTASTAIMIKAKINTPPVSEMAPAVNASTILPIDTNCEIW